MKYKKISNDKQYNKYCEQHETLVRRDNELHLDEIELLEILIDEYENRDSSYEGRMNPVELLKYLLEEEEITRSKLAKKLHVSRQLITDILMYRRGLSKSVVWKLSEFFKMDSRAFNREYRLKNQRPKPKKKNA